MLFSAFDLAMINKYLSTYLIIFHFSYFICQTQISFVKNSYRQFVPVSNFHSFLLFPFISHPQLVLTHHNKNLENTNSETVMLYCTILLTHQNNGNTKLPSNSIISEQFQVFLLLRLHKIHRSVSRTRDNP